MKLDEREEKAMEALIVASVRAARRSDITLEELRACARFLSDEDRAALEALGPNLGARIVQGEVTASAARAVSSVPEEDFAIALNRAEENAELTDKAREEMEQKIRELNEESRDQDE